MLPQCMDLVLLIFASNTDLKNKYQTTYIFSFIWFYSGIHICSKGCRVKPIFWRPQPLPNRPAQFSLMQVHLISWRRYEGAGNLSVIIDMGCQSTFLSSPCSSSICFKRLWVFIFWSSCNMCKLKVLLGGRSIKSFCIRSCSGPYFPAFGLNTERYFISLYWVWTQGNMK